MKTLYAGILVGLISVTGCDRESPRGGPGAKDTATTTTTKKNGTTTTVTKEGDKRADTFTIQVPSGDTNITQGKREEVVISVSRGSDFKQGVQLKFEAPTGLKVIPPTASVKGDDTKTNVFVEVADDATVGRHTITVTGQPESGKSTSVTMDVDVKKKG